MIRRPPRSTLFPYTDALPISRAFLRHGRAVSRHSGVPFQETPRSASNSRITLRSWRGSRSEEHTSELQSRLHLVCRLLLEKKNRVRGSYLIAAEDCRSRGGCV